MASSYRNTMSDEKKTNDAFNTLRDAFDALQVDEQARFLVEAAMSLVANGAREAGNVVSSVVDEVVDGIKRERESCCDDSEADSEDAAAEEPKPKAKPKPAAKKTTRKRAPRKPAADAGDA